MDQKEFEELKIRVSQLETFHYEVPNSNSYISLPLHRILEILVTPEVVEQAKAKHLADCRLQRQHNIISQYYNLTDPDSDKIARDEMLDTAIFNSTNPTVQSAKEAYVTALKMAGEL